MINVKALFLKALGFLFTLPALFGALAKVWKHGWTLTTRMTDRPLPPQTLEDPKWGQHK